MLMLIMFTSDSSSCARGSSCLNSMTSPLFWISSGPTLRTPGRGHWTVDTHCPCLILSAYLWPTFLAWWLFPQTPLNQCIPQGPRPSGTLGVLRWILSRQSPRLSLQGTWPRQQNLHANGQQAQHLDAATSSSIWMLQSTLKGTKKIASLWPADQTLLSSCHSQPPCQAICSWLTTAALSQQTAQDLPI